MDWRYEMDHLEGGFDLFQGLGRKESLSSGEISCHQNVDEECPQSQQRNLWGTVFALTRNSGTNQDEGKLVH